MTKTRDLWGTAGSCEAHVTHRCCWLYLWHECKAEGLILFAERGRTSLCFCLGLKKISSFFVVCFCVHPYKCSEVLIIRGEYKKLICIICWTVKKKPCGSFSFLNHSAQRCIGCYRTSSSSQKQSEPDIWWILPWILSIIGCGFVQNVKVNVIQLLKWSYEIILLRIKQCLLFLFSMSNL